MSDFGAVSRRSAGLPEPLVEAGDPLGIVPSVVSGTDAEHMFLTLRISQGAIQISTEDMSKHLVFTDTQIALPP